MMSLSTSVTPGKPCTGMFADCGVVYLKLIHLMLGNIASCEIEYRGQLTVSTKCVLMGHSPHHLQELDMALETLETLRERHPAQLTAAAYGVLIGACAARGRGTEGVDVFGVFRLDAACSVEAAMQPTPFLFW